MKFRNVIGSGCLLLLVFLVACSSDGDSPSSPDIPVVVQDGGWRLRTGWWEVSGEEEFTTDIPSNIAGVHLSITTGAGTETHDLSLEPSAERAEFTVTLPANEMAFLEMDALDENGVPVYHGASYHQTPVGRDSLYQTMLLVGDTSAPEFSDNLTATPRSSSNLELQWEPATSGSQMDYRASYLVWATPTGQTPPDLPLLATCAGEESVFLGNLQADTSYDVVVKAVDEAGNISQVSATATVSTFSGSLDGLFVDPVHGEDAPGNGSSGHPFKTITYALSRASGDETITLRSGTYSVATGEVFPLQLKPGIKLCGALQFDPLFPLARLEIPDCNIAVVGAGWNFLSGIQMIAANAETRAYCFLDASGSDLFMQFMVLDGNGGGSEHGVKAGGTFLIKNSLFRNFPAGTAVSLFSDGSHSCNITSCRVRDSQVGIMASRAASVVYCGVSDCGIGLYCYMGDGIFINRATVSRSSTTGVQIEDSKNIYLTASSILFSGNCGIDIFGSEPYILIYKCQIQSEEAIGVEIRSCEVTLEQNTISCNRTNLWVRGGEQVDARRNSWHESPPVVLSDGDSTEGYDIVDVFYEAVYSGTPQPLVSPSLGSSGCTIFAINPLVKGL